MVGDMGSSLMSERGYDSDAQYIGSPQHADHLRASPGSPAVRRMGLHDLIEHSRERNDLEMWAGSASHDQPDSPGTPFGMHYIPTPTGSLRGHSAHPNSATEGTGSQSVAFIQQWAVGGSIHVHESSPKSPSQSRRISSTKPRSPPISRRLYRQQP